MASPAVTGGSNLPGLPSVSLCVGIAGFGARFPLKPTTNIRRRICGTPNSAAFSSEIVIAYPAARHLGRIRKIGLLLGCRMLITFAKTNPSGLKSPNILKYSSIRLERGSTDGSMIRRLKSFTATLRLDLPGNCSLPGASSPVEVQ